MCATVSPSANQPTTPPRPEIAVVLGTRPEIIKLAGVIQALGSQARVLYTGQHYDAAMSWHIWHERELPEPEIVCRSGGLPRALQLSDTVAALHHAFTRRRPHTVIVHGDTNATLAGALAANAHGIRLIHVEAGLRSHDRAMPEEHNRVLVSQLADVLCAPTPANVDNLTAMGIPPERIHLTGNTIVEATRHHLPESDARQELLSTHELTPRQYVLATLHRPENTDRPEALSRILEELARVDLPVVLPLHPRTQGRIKSFGLDGLLEPFVVTPPLPSRDFLGLAAEAAVLISDSGGVQEECTVLKRPLLIVRGSTERPESLGLFAQRVTPGPGISGIVNAWLRRLSDIHGLLAGTPCPYGDGSASEVIARIALASTEGSPGPTTHSTAVQP